MTLVARAGFRPSEMKVSRVQTLSSEIKVSFRSYVGRIFVTLKRERRESELRDVRYSVCVGENSQMRCNGAAEL